jgi:exonuclease SbcC
VVQAIARVEALEASRTKASRTEAAALARAQAARPRQAQAEARKSAAAARRSGHREAWAEVRAQLGQPLPPEEAEDAGAQRWLAEAAKETQERRAAAQAEEEAAEARTRAAREARAVLESCRSRLEAAVEALRRAEDSLGESERALRQAERDAEQAGAARQQGLVDLTPAFAGWSDWETRLAAEPSGFRKHCAEQVSAWNMRQEALRAAQAREADARASRAAAEAKRDTLHEAAEEDARSWKRAEAALQQTLTARAKVLEGRPTEQVRTSLRAAVDTATLGYEKARDDTNLRSRCAQHTCRRSIAQKPSAVARSLTRMPFSLPYSGRRVCLVPSTTILNTVAAVVASVHRESA